MPDQHHPDGPAYDWLYSAGAGRRPPDAPDPDATQAIDAGRAADPDATQAIDAGGWPLPETTGGANVSASGQSFGGTFADPVSNQAKPGFATQVHSRPTRPTAAQSRRAPFASGSPPRRGAGGASSPPPRGPARGGQSPTRSPSRNRNWWVRGALGLFLAWLVFLVAVPIWAWSTISKVDAEPGGRRPPQAAGTTYLLVGSDSRAGLTKAQEANLGTGSAAGQRTDTIILLDVPATGPTLLLSIPRDSYVDIPGHGHSKINAAYSIGGPKLLVRTVERATKVRIDNYIEIGFAGFVDVVDAVGGIQVCPKTSINDRKAGHLNLQKGCQHVDGRTALGYSRSRAFPNGDITRALHQREVIGAVGHQAASWKTIVLPWRYFRLNTAAAKAVQVGKNVSPIDVMRFAWAMAHVGGSNTKRCVVPYSNLGAATSAGSAVLWDQQRAHRLFAAIRSGDTSSVHCAPQ